MCLDELLYEVETDITLNNTHIKDSYKIPKCYIKDVLRALMKEVDNPSVAINRIPLNKMIEEWKAHNLLYELHIARNRTKDVDLDIFESDLRRFEYKILSKIYDIFY